MELPLDDCFDFLNGGSWSENEYSDDGVHVVKVTNLVNGSVERRSDNYLPLSKYEKYKKHQLHEGDVVIATVGSHPTQQGSVVGRTSRIPSEFEGSLLNQNAVCLKNKNPECVHTRYFYYVTRTTLFKGYIEGRAKGSANQVRMAIGDLKKFKLDFPAIETQKKIGAILSAYDDLIENNKRRIALLEKMGKEIYREWFVRFRFPGFQTAEFEKGFPKYFELKKFSTFCKFEKGRNPIEVTNTPVENDYPYINMDTLNGNQKSFATKQKNSIISIQGEILMLMDGSRSGLTFRANVTGIVGSTLSVIRVADSLRNIVYEYLKAMEVEIIFNNTGSAIPHANKDYINRMLIGIPKNNNIIDKFNSTYDAIYQQVEDLQAKIVYLTSTKNMLLPRLISGKLSVEDLDIQYPPSMQEDNAA